MSTKHQAPDKEQKYLASQNADQLITEAELMVPFPVNDIALLHEYKDWHNQQYQTEFDGLNAFVALLNCTQN